MGRSELSDGSVRILKLIAILAGTLLVIAAVFADLIGLSAGGGVSRNQVGFLICGIALILSGLLGRKLPEFYRGTAILVFNVIVAIVILEFASIILVKLIDRDRFNIRARKIEEGNLELVEESVVLGMYAPFVVWRSNPALNSDSVTVTAEGFRITPGASLDTDAYKVFLLGGSAMWGTNVSDSGTIGAYLQASLSEYMQRPVAVSNMAQTAHSSTQEVIELMLQLRSGNVPDFVIYYDGFNDVWGAYEAGRAGTHHSEGPISARVEGRPEAFNVHPPLEALLMESNTWLLVTSLHNRMSDRESELQRIETYHTKGIDPDSLAADVVETYLGNCGIVEALAAQYGFECLFVWQPSVWFGEKTLTESELDIYEGGYEFFLAGGDPAFKVLYTATYGLFDEVAVDSLHYLSFARIFDSVEETVYNDYSGVHVEPWANEIIAEELLINLLELDPISAGTADSLPEEP